MSLNLLYRHIIPVFILVPYCVRFWKGVDDWIILHSAQWIDFTYCIHHLDDTYNVEISYHYNTKSLKIKDFDTNEKSRLHIDCIGNTENYDLDGYTEYRCNPRYEEELFKQAVTTMMLARSTFGISKDVMRMILEMSRYKSNDVFWDYELVEVRNKNKRIKR